VVGEEGEEMNREATLSFGPYANKCGICGEHYKTNDRHSPEACATLHLIVAIDKLTEAIKEVCLRSLGN